MKKSLGFLFVFILILAVTSELSAQCSMCKAVLESNQAAGENLGGGINDGIVYLMGIPYLLIMTAGYFIYKNHKKDKSVTAE